MSLKKFMHPKNKYKVDPDFKQLALVDPNFQKVAITLLNGKVSINFKDENSLITLTKTLLKHDFNLDVNIPPMKLVPALPLRLNYILWIEDILNYGQFLNDEVHGIDIGVGAVCIYPLLIAHEYKWKMTGTEIDPTSYECAIENVKRNKLDNLIDVQLVNKDTILKEIIKDTNNITFVMCNPPFFKTDDMTKLKKNPPRNAATGCERELFVEGGEQKFISRLIDDSIELKDRVKIYTTMFGKKNTLSLVKRELAEKNITNATWTEFCQGYTKRWGLAWTFLPEELINLKKAPVIRTSSSTKKTKDSTCMICFPDTSEISSLEDLNDVYIKSVLELKVKSKEMDLECNECDCYAYELIASEDSWSHARRKRRMAMRNEASNDAKKPCLENLESMDRLEISESENAEETVEEKVYLKCNVLIQEINSSDNEESNEDLDQEKTSKPHFCVRFVYESGDGGKQALETLRQYFINKLNVRNIISRPNPQKKPKKKKK